MPSYEYGDYSGKINEIIGFYDYFNVYDDNAKAHAYGCFLPQFGKKALTFWHSHNEPGMSALFYTVCDGTETSNYLLTIPSLLKEIRDFTPVTMNSGYVYAIYQGNRYMLENPDEEPSPLASRILTLAGNSFNDEYLIILRARMLLKSAANVDTPKQI